MAKSELRLGHPGVQQGGAGNFYRLETIPGSARPASAGREAPKDPSGTRPEPRRVSGVVVDSRGNARRRIPESASLPVARRTSGRTDLRPADDAAPDGDASKPVGSGAKDTSGECNAFGFQGQ